MANIIHSTIKNKDYNAAPEYLEFKHKEIKNNKGKIVKYEPILDQEGNFIPREDIRRTYLGGDGEERDPSQWSRDCRNVNSRYNQNKEAGDVKGHHIVASFSKEDMEQNHITADQVQQYGIDYAKQVFPGHQAYIVTHTDTAHWHVHIVINSCREKEFEPTSEYDYMLKNKNGVIQKGQYCAGGKFSWTNKFNHFAHDQADKLSLQYGFFQENNNQKAVEKKKQIVEKWKHNPKNIYLRNAILMSAIKCNTESEMIQYLKNNYNVKYRRRGKTVTLFHPDNETGTRLRSLGLENSDIFEYNKEHLQKLLAQENRYKKQQEHDLKEQMDILAIRIKKEKVMSQPWTQRKEKKRYPPVKMYDSDGNRYGFLVHLLMFSIIVINREIPECMKPDWEIEKLRKEERTIVEVAIFRVKQFRKAIEDVIEEDWDTYNDIERVINDKNAPPEKVLKAERVKEQLKHAIDKEYCQCVDIMQREEETPDKSEPIEQESKKQHIQHKTKQDINR